MTDALHSRVSIRRFAIWRLLRRLTSANILERAEARYQLSMYVRGIDLRCEAVEELGVDATRCNEHVYSGGPSDEAVLRNLSISPHDEVIDLGAGKGGAMISLAKLPFRRIDGIEVSPELIRIARRNLARLDSLRGSIFLSDAAEFHDFDRYTFVYMYNPFPDSVLRKVLLNLELSLTRVPRTLTLVYRNPVAHELVLAAGFRQIREFTYPSPFFRIYQR